MRRFYKQASVHPAEGGAFQVSLDGRELRSPGKRALRFPNAGLAEAVAAEWQAQGDSIDIRTMPLMSLASTAADRIGPMRDQIIGEIARYAETDLVCYRADEPETLVMRQEQAWQPLVDWLAMRFDARLDVHTGILPKPQAREALGALRLALETMDDLTLAALSSVTAATGSLVIALALVERRIGPDEAAAASQLDERFQAEIWGEDPEAEGRRAALAEEIAAADRWLDLLRSR